MKAFKQPFSFISAALLCYFLIPYLIFLKYFNLDFNLDYAEAWWAFKNSSLQAFVTAVIVTGLSIPLSFGIFTLKNPWFALTQKLLLLPQILPALFSILIVFSMVDRFPMGTTGIIIIFTVMHLGFATVLLTAATQERMGSFGLIAEVYDVGRFKFYRRVYCPLMKSNLLTIFVLVFIFCFASFSVPLVAGGGRGTNLEVLIYEKIFINQNWSLAWTLNLLQSFFIFILSYLILKKSALPKVDFEDSKYMQFRLGRVGLFIYLALYGGGYLMGLVKARGALAQFQALLPEIILATQHTLKIMVFYILINILLLITWVYDYVKSGRQNSSRHLLATSTILVGFSFYLLIPETSLGDYFKIILSMTILFFPPLFRSFLEKPLDQLDSQILTCKIFNISTSKIVFTVVLRQIKKPIFLWLSFLTIWFLSDFAILKSLGVRTATVGLMAESFLSSYRLSLAYLLSFYILIVWVFTLLAIYLLKGVFGVINKKFAS